MAPVGHVKEMADYGIQILREDETLEGFKQRAYGHACGFDIKNILPKYEALYESVLGAKIAI